MAAAQCWSEDVTHVKGREAPARWLILERWLHDAVVVVTWHWSHCEEIPHVQGQRRSSSKTVGVLKSRVESNPIPARDAQRAHTNLVCTSTQRPQRLRQKNGRVELICKVEVELQMYKTNLRLPRGDGVWTNWEIGIDIYGGGELVAKLCQTLCDPRDCNPPSASVHGIFQARILEWVAISFTREFSPPRDCTWISCIAGRFFTMET